MRFSWTIIVLLLICCLFPFFPFFLEPIFIATAVRSVENIQALMLFGAFVFTLIYMQPWNMRRGQKYFWFWAAAWWLLLCGRSTSWGRDYFPEVPKIYFRMISIVLIGNVVFMLFSKHLRQEIGRKFKTFMLPIWAVTLAIAGLIISDSIEHLRGLHVWFVFDLKYQDLIEELYEFPLIIGLFLVAWSVMVKDLQSKQKHEESLAED